MAARFEFWLSPKRGLWDSFLDPRGGFLRFAGFIPNNIRSIVSCEQKGSELEKFPGAWEGAFGDDVALLLRK